MPSRFFFLLFLLCSGCVSQRMFRLPPLSADEISVTHTDWFGSITASGTSPKITETYITWAEAKWTLTYGGWHDEIRAKNYRQKREKEDAK